MPKPPSFVRKADAASTLPRRPPLCHGRFRFRLVGWRAGFLTRQRAHIDGELLCLLATSFTERETSAYSHYPLQSGPAVPGHLTLQRFLPSSAAMSLIMSPALRCAPVIWSRVTPHRFIQYSTALRSERSSRSLSMKPRLSFNPANAFNPRSVPRKGRMPQLPLNGARTPRMPRHALSSATSTLAISGFLPFEVASCPSDCGKKRQERNLAWRPLADVRLRALDCYSSHRAAHLKADTLPVRPSDAHI